MQFKTQNRWVSVPVVRMMLVFSLIIVVKSPDTFSEERDMMNEHNNLGYSGLQTESISINGKTFSFYRLKKVVDPVTPKQPSPKPILTPSTNILSKGNLSADMLSAFLLRNNPALNPGYALRLATVYVEEASDEGINTDVAFSQMCLETGFLKFGGDVSPNQNNFCGLGVTGHGVKGISFTDMRSGVRAHIQHLKAYASHESLINPLVDKRFNYVKRGSAMHVDELKGKWATDKNYDKKIISLLKKMYSLTNRFPS